MRIIVVDDDRLVVDSLKIILGAQPQIEVVGTGADGNDAVALYAEYAPDIALLDIQMPGRDGLSAAREILERDPAARVVFLTTFSDDEYIVSALKLGARGYLIKTDVAAIPPALAQVMDGKRVLEGKAIEDVDFDGTDAEAGTPRRPAAFAALTDREFEVAELIARGLDNKEIAADIPGNINIGAEYSVKPNFRVSLGANYYFDKQSKQYNNETDLNDKQNYLKHNSFEILGGLEYDLSDVVTLSIGANSSTFGFGNDAKYISDLSYTTSSISGGLGARFNVNPKVAIDLGIYKTFFMHFTKEQADYGGNGALIAAKLSPVLGQLAPAVPGLAEKLDIKNLQIPGQDDFYRTSIVGGIGVTFKF